MNSKYLINMMLEGKSASTVLDEATTPKEDQIWRSTTKGQSDDFYYVKIDSTDSNSVYYRPFRNGKVDKSSSGALPKSSFTNTYEFVKDG